MILGVWSSLKREGGSLIDLHRQEIGQVVQLQTGANKAGVALLVDAMGSTKCDN